MPNFKSVSCKMAVTGERAESALPMCVLSKRPHLEKGYRPVLIAEHVFFPVVVVASFHLLSVTPIQKSTVNDLISARGAL